MYVHVLRLPGQHIKIENDLSPPSSIKPTKWGLRFRLDWKEALQEFVQTCSFRNPGTGKALKTQ